MQAIRRERPRKGHEVSSERKLRSNLFFFFRAARGLQLNVQVSSSSNQEAQLTFSLHNKQDITHLGTFWSSTHRMAAQYTQDRIAALKAKEPFRWQQARQAIRFNYLRAGILQEGTPEQIAALVDPTKPQPWHQNRPGREFILHSQQQRPRADRAFPTLAGIPINLHNLPNVYAAQGSDQKGNIPAENRQKATSVVNDVTRGLDKIVSFFGCRRWVS